LIPETVGALAARSGRNGGASNQEADAGQVIAFGGSANCAETDVSTAVSAHPGGYRLDAETETFITHALRADSFDASEDGTGRGTPLVPCSYSPEVSAPLMARSSRGGGQVNSPGYQADEQLIAFDSKASGRNGFGVGEMAPTLRAMGHKDSHSNAGGQIAVAVSVSQNSNGFAWEGEVAATLQTSQQTGQGNQFDGLRTQSGVRRLTPRECERLQGFPDDHTLIRFNGKAAADGPRYKALGNSMAVPVMRWIGERIQLVEGIQQDRQEAA
jgi:DNA (cytosine-5)-methyltransferase 1